MRELNPGTGSILYELSDTKQRLQYTPRGAAIAASRAAFIAGGNFSGKDISTRVTVTGYN